MEHRTSRNRNQIKKLKVQPLLLHSTRNSSFQDSCDKVFLSPKEIFPSRSIDFFTEYLVCISTLALVIMGLIHYLHHPSQTAHRIERKRKWSLRTRRTNLVNKDIAINIDIICLTVHSRHRGTGGNLEKKSNSAKP